MNKFILREFFEDELTRMVGSLDVGSLEAILRSTQTSNFTIPQEKRSRDGISELLVNQTDLSKEKLLEKLYQAEANRPFKHVVLAKYTGNLEGLSEELMGQEFGLMNPIPNVEGFTCSFFADEESYLTLTFEHTDDSVHHYFKDGGRFPKTVHVRHPFVISISKNNPIVLINFPGYSRESRSDYSDLLSELSFIFTDKINIGFQALPIKKVVSAFLEKRTSRFVFDDVQAKNTKGSFGLSSALKGFSVDELLPSLMVEKLPAYSSEQIREALVHAIKKFNESSEVLFWFDESVYTRINYYDIGTELYFTWKGVSPSYDRVWSIVGFLYTVSLGIESDHDILSLIVNSDNDSLITPKWLIEQSSLSEKEIKRQLAKYVAEGLLKVVYKVKDNSKYTSPIVNKWHSNLETLREEVVSEHDLITVEEKTEVLKDIEVAFKFSEAKESNGLS